jgi:hypothetical protein
MPGPGASAPPPAPGDTIPPAGRTGDDGRTVMQSSPFAEDERPSSLQMPVVPPHTVPIAVAKEGELVAAGRGTLEVTPLPHVLVYMLDHSLTGTVVFREPNGVEHTIYFVRGVPANARLGHAAALLGEQLILAGDLPRSALEVGVESARRLSMLLGEYLVTQGIVTKEAVAKAVSAQLYAKTASLANIPPETEYAYYRDVNLIETWGGGPLELPSLNPILKSVRVWKDRSRVKNTLQRIQKYPLAFHEDADLSALELDEAEEATMAAIVTRGVSLATLLQLKVAAESVVQSLVYTMAITRQLSFKGQKKGPMAPKGDARANPPLASKKPPPARPSVTPRVTKGSEGAKRSVSQRPGARKSVKPASPSAMPSAMPAVVSGTSPAAAPASAAPPTAPAPPPVHPARPEAAAPSIPQPMDADTKRTSLAEIFGLAGGGAGTETKRSTLEEILATLPPQPSQPQPPLGDTVPGGLHDDDIPIHHEDAEAEQDRQLASMEHFRQAQAALERGELGTAEKMSRLAMEGDSTRHDYLALYAWVRALTGSTPVTNESLVMLSGIVEREPTHERALMYRGKLYKRVGRAGDAKKDFETLVRTYPHNREAASELRLLRGSK